MSLGELHRPGPVRPKVVILVSGLPAMGKTTVAKYLADYFELPLLTRDDLKEILFDVLGVADQSWSRKLGISSWHLMYRIADLLMRTKSPFIWQNYFKQQLDANPYMNVRDLHGYIDLQVRCWTTGDLILERFRHRVQSGDRHVGHADQDNLRDAEFCSMLLRGGDDAHDLLPASETIQINTTNIESRVLRQLTESIERYITRTTGQSLS